MRDDLSDGVAWFDVHRWIMIAGSGDLVQQAFADCIKWRLGGHNGGRLGWAGGLWVAGVE